MHWLGGHLCPHLPIQASSGNISQAKIDVKDNRKTREEANPFLIIEQEEPFAPSKGWADMIRKVYETDPFLYPKYGWQMRIIAFIEDHKVIDHLKLTFEAERPPPPRVVQQNLLMAAKEREESLTLPF